MPVISIKKNMEPMAGVVPKAASKNKLWKAIAKWSELEHYNFLDVLYSIGFKICSDDKQEMNLLYEYLMGVW